MKKAIFIIVPFVLAFLIGLTIILVDISEKNSDDNKDDTKKSSSQKETAEDSIPCTIKLQAKASNPLSDNEIEQTIQTLEKRLKELDCEKVDVSENNGVFTVKFASEMTDESAVRQATDKIFTQGKLFFREGNQIDGRVLIDYDDIKEASAEIHAESAQNIVNIEFTEEGTEKFAAATRELVGQTISIWIDDTCISTPRVSSPITEGTCFIDGMVDHKEAASLASLLNSKPLPYDLQIVSIEI